VTNLKRLLIDEDGQDMVEYSLLLVAIALIAVVGASTIGPLVNARFASMSAKIT